MIEHLQHYVGEGTPVAAEESVPLMYQLSYMYYNTCGLLVGLIVGLIVSYITGPEDISKINPNLFIPQIRKYLPKPSNDNKDIDMSNLEKTNSNEKPCPVTTVSYTHLDVYKRQLRIQHQ